MLGGFVRYIMLLAAWRGICRLQFERLCLSLKINMHVRDMHSGSVTMVLLLVNVTSVDD